MSAASEKRSTGLSEPVPSERPTPDAIPGERRPDPAPAVRGRAARALVVIAVIAVECAWLVAIAYAVWRLARLL